jgi:hypothetical protein
MTRVPVLWALLILVGTLVVYVSVRIRVDEKIAFCSRRYTIASGSKL